MEEIILTDEQFLEFAAKYRCTHPGCVPWIDVTEDSFVPVAQAIYLAARQEALEEAAQVAVSKLKDLTTEMEGYSYFGSNPGVKEVDYDDVADAIRGILV
jgi:hypothetical protein